MARKRKKTATEKLVASNNDCFNNIFITVEQLEELLEQLQDSNKGYTFLYHWCFNNHSIELEQSLVTSKKEVQQQTARMSQDVQLTSKGELEKIKCILSSTYCI